MVEMKNKIFIFISEARKYTPLLMLAVIFSGIAIASFHNHDCTENSDLCTVCRFQHSFSSPSIEPTAHVAVLPQPLTKPLVTLDERITDPSQKIVCSSHAPPQYS
jgi:hypothetical protein